MHAGESTLVSRTIDGRYRVERELGRGGMGAVYAAVHVGLGKPVAIKVLHSALTEDPVVMERFQREARTASAIGHRGLVPVTDFGTFEGGAFIAMELVDGVSLASWILERAPLPIETVLAIGIDVADALVATHEHGVVHRDLKPSNILIDAEGRARVTDFGVAKIVRTDEGTALTKSGEVLGTPLYMSPEQCGGKHVDARTDVYALGLTLFEMVAGRPPFLVAGVVQIISHHLLEPAPSLASLREGVPPALVALVARCLEKSPDARPASMRELRDALQAIADGRTEATPMRSTGPLRELETRATDFALVRSDPSLDATEAASGARRVGANEDEPILVPPAEIVGADTAQRSVTAVPTPARSHAPPPPAPAPTSRRNVWLALVLALGCALGGVVAYAMHDSVSAGTSAPVATPRVTVEVRSRPAADVLVDGRAIGRTPLRIEPGAMHGALTLRADGYDDEVVPLDAARNEDIEVALRPIAAIVDGIDPPVEPSAIVEPVTPEPAAVGARRASTGHSGRSEAASESPSGTGNSGRPTHPDITDPFGDTP
ncbi:MAG: protein kinase [Sandaracinaceae bacterium]